LRLVIVFALFTIAVVKVTLNIEQQGVPDVIPAEACYLGWQESLRKLTKLVNRRSTSSAVASGTALGELLNRTR
jgi:ABC-type Fe3+-hydroxamate transport system substrate-binding protein